MKNLHIYVEGDINDGDYISEVTDISDLTKEEVIDIYNKLKSYNPRKGKCPDEIMDYLPWLDNEELHTITDVQLQIIENIELKDLEKNV
jgi:hypothetical protein